MNQFPSKNYFTMPNEIFSLGLDASEIAVYAYLRCLENRSTYQCWPSYPATVWHRAFSRSCWQTSRHTASRQKMNGRLVKVGKGEIRNNGKKTRQRRRQYS